MAEAVEMPPETKEEIINAPKLAFIPVYQRCTGSVDDEHMETFQKKAGLSTEDVQVMKGIIEDGFQYFVCIRCLALQCFSMAPLLGGGAAMIARFMTHDFTIPIIIGISSLVTLFIGSILGLIWWVNKHETQESIVLKLHERFPSMLFKMNSDRDSEGLGLLVLYPTQVSLLV